MTITRDTVLEALKAAKAPRRNVEIRRAILGAGNEEKDRAGTLTTAALQKLKAEGLVAMMHGSRWGLSDVIDCPACDGRGYLTKERAVKLGLVK